MISVEFPAPQFRLKKRGEKPYIFDSIRRRWLLLTEEEWVRQNFIAYLTVVLHYPSELITLEKEIWLNDLKKRFDILVFDKSHLPYLLVECKAPAVPLNDAVLQQVLRYNLSTPVRFIVITNGISTMAWEKTGEGLVALTEMPDGSMC